MVCLYNGNFHLIYYGWHKFDRTQMCKLWYGSVYIEQTKIFFQIGRKINTLKKPNLV